MRHTESSTLGERSLNGFSFMQFTSAPVSTLTTRWYLWGPLGCVAFGNLRFFPHDPLLVPIWLTILSIFTLGGFGCLTPFLSMWVSSSSWGCVWTRLALLVLFLDWHTLWKCPILWQSLHFAFLAGHFYPSWCSGSPHLMDFPSIPGGFLDWRLWFEDLCAPEWFCPWFFPLAHFCLLLLPLFCLQLYAAKFTYEVESS